MRHLLIFSAFALAACGPSVVQVGTQTETAAPVAAPDVQPAAPVGAYMIVQGKNYEPAALGPYAARMTQIYSKYGGRYVSFETDIDVAEGDSEYQAVNMSAWPSKAAARAFWDSPEYAEAIKLREGIGEFDVVIVGALPER
jgi:uncharacterized protein (DUF1330 family)